MAEGRRRAVATGVVVLAGIALLAWAAGVVVGGLHGASAAPWVLARAAGVTSYLLLTALAMTGVVLTHPWARRWSRPAPTTRLALHAGLATFTLAFTALHVVVLATDPWARVGWAGALLPMASEHRPVPVTLGVLALWAGVLTGVTARWAGRLAPRLWWPVHRGAVSLFVLAWAHSVLAGTDTPQLAVLYVVTGGAVALLAVSRYAARSPEDRAAELAGRLTTQTDASTHGRVLGRSR